MKWFFSKLWAGWKKFAHALGVFNTKVILTIMYFIVFAIAALLSRIFRPDLIDKKWTSTAPMWKPRKEPAPDLETARRQF